MADDIKKIASEALELHRKIASDKKRLLDLKKQISEASVGKNSSYKIPLDKGTVKINMVKESLSYSFDQEEFKKLDNQIKDKFLEEEVVKKDLSYSFDQEGFKKLDNQIKDKLFEEEVIKENLNYSLNKNKIETIKSESEFKQLGNTKDNPYSEAAIKKDILAKEQKNLLNKKDAHAGMPGSDIVIREIIKDEAIDKLKALKKAKPVQIDYSISKELSALEEFNRSRIEDNTRARRFHEFIKKKQDPGENKAN